MEWTKGQIPNDGRMYITAASWIGSNGNWSVGRYELQIAYIDERGVFRTGTGSPIRNHQPSDVEFYLLIPQLLND